jgi:CRISPR/Cas system-associated endoribonuclease Cas2
MIRLLLTQTTAALRTSPSPRTPIPLPRAILNPTRHKERSMQSTYAQPGHVVAERSVYAGELHGSTEAEATQLESAVNRARHQAEETHRIVALGEQMIARLTGMGLEEQKGGLAPMPCGLIPQLDAHLSDQDKALGALNAIFERLGRLV